MRHFIGYSLSPNESLLCSLIFPSQAWKTILQQELQLVQESERHPEASHWSAKEHHQLWKTAPIQHLDENATTTENSMSICQPLLLMNVSHKLCWKLKKPSSKLLKKSWQGLEATTSWSCARRSTWGLVALCGQCDQASPGWVWGGFPWHDRAWVPRQQASPSVPGVEVDVTSRDMASARVSPYRDAVNASWWGGCTFIYGNAAHVCGARRLLMRAPVPYATCHSDWFILTVSECFSRTKLQAGKCRVGWVFTISKQGKAAWCWSGVAAQPAWCQSIREWTALPPTLRAADNAQQWSFICAQAPIFYAAKAMSQMFLARIDLLR